MAATYNNTGSLEIKIQSEFVKTNSTYSKPKENINKTISKKFTYGNSADMSQVSYFIEQSIAATGTFVLDLYALASEIGGTLPLVKLTNIVIEHVTQTNTGNVTIGANATGAFSSWLSASGTTIPLTPGGVVLKSDPKVGLTVSSTNRNIKFANLDAANAAVLNIWVTGNIS